MLKRVLKISGRVLLGIVALLLVAVLLINYSPVQTWLAGRAAAILSERMNTKVSVGHVRIKLLNSLLVQEVSIRDQQGDTLLYAGEVSASITDWFIFKDKPVLHYLGLKNTFVHLQRDSAIWNYAFIEDAFSTPKSTKKTKTSSSFELDLRSIALEQVRIHMDDKWIGEDLHFDIGSMEVDAKGIDYKTQLIDIKEIAVANTGIHIYEYTGARPAHLRPKHTGFDTTAFNPDKWGVAVGKVELKGCSFSLTDGDREPVPGQFDETHIRITGIDIDVDSVQVVGDTINGRVNNLTAYERSGLVIKTMQSRVTVSPVASICRDLYLETNNSVLKDYYAMHYRHFPDFNNYIDSVSMVAHLDGARVDKRDVRFFAEELDNLPDIVATISGEGRGTVSDISARGLKVTDGDVTITGDLAMQGLPDINTTLITYANGTITASNKGLMHYAPALRNNDAFAADSISSIVFTGMYEGYIDNFRVNGEVTSAQGEAGVDVQLRIPGFVADSAVYSGTVHTRALQVGKLLKLPYLGDITMNEKISGHSFNPDNMQLRLDGEIGEFVVNGYRYHKIFTEGTLARQQFDGRVLVDDPNLALDFDGHVNYAGHQLRINAMAHLLASNFRALKLTSDSMTASADFDLNWEGSTIDNFRGYGKLFNIDLRRDAHRLDIDSVYVRSGGDTTNRTLTVNSDAFTARVTGNYRLSSLPASVQYYLSRYIPNYIKPPEKYAPGQVFDFRVTTARIDSIFALTIPDVRGGDYATVSGSMNTVNGKLSLNADIPYFSAGAIAMHGITLEGLGNLRSIAIHANADFVSIADSVLKGEASITTTVGEDTVNFTLATVSPDKESSASLSGTIVAVHDTLTLRMLPSEFYLSKAKWEVAGGSKVVYATRYLKVDDVALWSGLQRITLSTNEANNGVLLLNAHNLDLAHIGNIAGISSYQPDGRIDGIISAGDIFDNLQLSVNMRATGVKLGNDTVGNINVVGGYDAVTQIINVDPQTGIFRDHASVVLSGRVSLDSMRGRPLSGAIRFRDARVAWASPFLAGLMSNIKGDVNGKVDIGGTVDKPVLSGGAHLTGAAFRFDYLGCTYLIPEGYAKVTENRITLDNISVYDLYRNKAQLYGYFSHDMFDKMRMRLTVTTPKLEVMNLTHEQNDLFYGKLTAGMDSFTIRGPFNNIRLNLYGGRPAAKSTIYIPGSTGSYTGGYNYVSFKTYGENQDPAKSKVKDKISIYMDANLNNLAEIHIVMDPATNDEIITRGSGNIQMDIPPNNDMRMTGLYTISEGTYTLTFEQFLIHRMFRLTPGSTIAFNGPFSETNLAVDATYTAKARLYDLLTTAEKTALGTDLSDAQTPQFVNVILHMNGPIYSSRLSFDLDLENNHSKGTLAGRKLQLINNDERQKFDQVASLLLVGTFMPNDGIGGSARSGAINNVSQVAASTVSAGLTKAVNKLLGDRNLNVAVKYTNYGLGENTSGTWNQLKLGVTKNYINDRLLVSVGSTSDWGRPANTTTATNFNFAPDVRLQYVLSGNSGLRLNAFQTSDFDIVQNRNVQRVGAGISWRRSFDNLGEFFGGQKYQQRQREKKLNQDTTGILPDSTQKRK